MIYENVQITFLTGDDVPYSERASIRQSDEEMVIDIGAPSRSQRAYLVRGRPFKGFFAGEDEVAENEPLNIVARWAELGDIWVGWWSEEGVEYLFSFRLPRNVASASPSAKGRRRPPFRGRL
jgi:hypothetical protein